MRRLTLRIVLGLSLVLSGNLWAADDEAGEVTTLTAKALRLQVPKSWKAVKSPSEFRAAQAQIPPAAEGGEGAELVVFYFGGGATGGIQANVNRWLGQFQEAGRTVAMRRGKGAQGEYIWVDVAGTWKKPDGPPFAQKTIDKPDSRVINVIAMVDQDGQKEYYFLKLSGPAKLVQDQAAALRRALGGSADAEKPFKLEDAEN
ncbi:MAG: hypothetical protein J5I93_00525 [Pirellulaceae bacterium]|nr:hypothetical protein [Pirellulaceae bacterium]